MKKIMGFANARFSGDEEYLRYSINRLRGHIDNGLDTRV